MTGEGRTPVASAQEVLRARARELARPPQPAQAAGSWIEVLEFRLGQESYALESRHVQEVYPLKQLTPLPCTPPFLLGVVNVRGRITPVIDIKKFFDLPDEGLTDLHRVIVIRGEGVELGLLADVVVGVRTLALDSLRASVPTLTGVRADYLKGVTAQRLVVLDAARILTDPKIIVDDHGEN